MGFLACPHPAASRRPRAVFATARSTAPSAGAGPPGRRIFSSCPCSPPSFLRPHASFGAGRARLRPSGAGHPLADHPRPHRRSGPDRSPSERSSGLPSLRALLALRCPGSGPSGSLVRLASVTVAPVLRESPLGSPSRLAGGEIAVRPRSLLVANQWIANTSAVVGSMLRGPVPIQSLPTPRSLHALCLELDGDSPQTRREDAESRQGGDRGGDRHHAWDRLGSDMVRRGGP